MSKRRQNVPEPEGDLPAPVGSDLAPYVVFTQLKKDGPFVYAGWLDAVDAAMAMFFAREHYGQDQKCTQIWTIPRPAIGGTDADHPVSTAEGASRTYRVFRQRGEATVLSSAETIDATSAAVALTEAVKTDPDVEVTWVVAEADIAATGPDDLIWRHTDQTYRLARGYAKTVREKWERVRNQPALAEYEKEELKEAF
ncbi:MAG: hypothetical protein HKO59_16765 [Phycisphaerales bacterium]|nr:hypothetical protein [Phycisphaerae bacterium]NNF42987.1 hypothetical protein [Phycisphaerales bacterium]NNM27603.1 hypothetical protein [Phycisphaerales bacterium]